MSIRGFIDSIGASVPGANESAPTKVGPNKRGEFPIGHPMHNKTPAPSDENARDYTFGRSQYGSNADFTPSSLPPGVSKNVGDGSGLLAQNQDDILDLVQSSGIKNEEHADENWQLRAIGSKNCEDGYGQESARSRQASTHSANAATVPGAIIKNDGPLPKITAYNSGTKS